MQEIKINIEKARLLSYAVSFKEDDKLPDVRAQIGLYTADGTEVSRFDISTATYAAQQFELPITMIPPIKKLATQLEKVIVRFAAQKHNLIEGGSNDR